MYKYSILERVIVKNIIPRNVNINRGAAEVDNHILRDDFLDYHPLNNVYLFYYTRHYSLIFPTSFSSNHGAGSSKDSIMHICYEWMKKYLSQNGSVCKQF